MIPRTMGSILRHVALLAAAVALTACGDPTTADCGSMTAGGIARDCGWTVAGTRQCTPGTLVSVGCAAGCGLGRCGGDPILRVCSGGGTCTFAQAILTVDDADVNGDQASMRPGIVCTAGDPMQCPAAIFRCPQNGQFTVMVGPYQTAQTFSTTFGTNQVSCEIDTGTPASSP